MPAPHLTYRFGDFELDTAAYELRRKGRRVSMARQPMELLLLLLERPGEVVPRDAIRKRLWDDDVFVDVDAGIRTAVLKIRQVLRDRRKSPRFVTTVPARGYRFLAPVHAVTSDGGHAPGVDRAGAEYGNAGRHNLPSDLTTFVGRDSELAQLRRLLSASRLLSLTGPGGVGKTRLATRLVADLARTVTGGVWLIDLAPLTTADQIAQATAAALGVRESAQRSSRDAAIDYVRNRELMLLFDTCEHILSDSAGLIEALLRAAPALRVVVTSREALSLPGETVFRVLPLALPDEAPSRPDDLAEFEATRLFVERAYAADPGFVIDSETAASIVGVCRRLDGIPLALELAAAQVATLSPKIIEARLEERLGLSAATRTSVRRQQTLDDTVDWSYQLLSKAERLVFARLSVFPSSWTLEAAAQVSGGDRIDPGDVPAIVSALVRKSLVNAAADAPGEYRYRFLDTVRHYAQSRLREAGDSDSLHDRHFEYCYGRFRDGLTTLASAEQAHWLERMQVEQDSLRAALDWSLSSPGLALRGVELASALFWFWTKRGLYAEGRHWLERAASIDAPPALRGRVAVGLGHMDYFQGRLADMAVRNEQTLACGREADDAWLIAVALFGQALERFDCGAYEEAAALAAASQDAAPPGRPAGSPLLVLGNVALIGGDQERALEHLAAAIENHRRAGEIWGLAIVSSVTAGLHIIRGDFDEARGHATEAMAISRELADPRGIAWALDVFAGLHSAAGRSDDAARLWGASDSLLERVGGILPPTLGWIRERYFPRSRTTLGEGRFARAHAQGRSMSRESAMALAAMRLEPALRRSISAR